MTLPASGTITLSQADVELGRANNAAINMNESAVRNMAGIASGAISMNNLHGKSAYTPMTVTDTGSSPSFSSYSSGGTATGNATCAASNGSGGYSYAWTITANASNCSLSGQSTATLTASHTYSSGQANTNYTVSAYCTVTDSTGHAVQGATVNIAMTIHNP